MVQKDKILFIDFNGVISYQPFWASLYNPNHQNHNWSQKIHEYLFSGQNSIVIDWMRAKYTSENVHDLLCRQLNISKPVLWNTFVGDCAKLDFSTQIHQALTKLASSYYLVLITDNMDCFDRFTMPAQPNNFAIFDRIDNSYNLGFLKSDNNAQYFVDTLTEFNIKPDNAVFIDDSAGNITAVSGRLPQVSVFQTHCQQEVVSALMGLITGVL